MRRLIMSSDMAKRVIERQLPLRFLRDDNGHK